MITPICAFGDSTPELVGVGLEGAGSWALISVHGETGLYNIGDRIADRWKLVKVERRCAVLIRTNDKHQSSICLNKIGAPSIARSASSRALFHESRTGLMDAAGLAALSVSPQAWIGDGGYARGAAKAPGFLLQRLGKGSFLSSIGLTEGDVIVQVNNLPIAQEGDLLRATSNIQDDHLEVIYERDNSEYSAAVRLSPEMVTSLKASSRPPKDERAESDVK